MDAAHKPAPLAQFAPLPYQLRRDPDHIYWVIPEGRALEDRAEGVTEVMTYLGFESDEYFTEEHSTRGIAVHAELANAANGLPEFPFFDPDLCGWRKSGKDFLAELLSEGAVVLGVEVMRWHPLYRYAGTIDLWMRWRGYEWVFDWKTGKASKITRFKLAAYDMLLGPTASGLPRKRAAIEVQEDGSRAKLVEYNKPENFHDGNRFLSYLNTARDLRAFAPRRH